MNFVLTTTDPAEILKLLSAEAARWAENEFSYSRTSRTQKRQQARQNRGSALQDFAAFISRIKVEPQPKYHIEAQFKCGQEGEDPWFETAANDAEADTFAIYDIMDMCVITFPTRAEAEAWIKREEGANQ